MENKLRHETAQWEKEIAQRDDKAILDQHDMATSLLGCLLVLLFSKRTTSSGDTKYLPSEINQAHPKVPDEKPALAI